jgi:hypothetical protein
MASMDGDTPVNIILHNREKTIQYKANFWYGTVFDIAYPTANE